MEARAGCLQHLLHVRLAVVLELDQDPVGVLIVPAAPRPSNASASAPVNRCIFMVFPPEWRDMAILVPAEVLGAMLDLLAGARLTAA